MKAAGLHFFQDRDTLDHERTWAELMAACQEMDGMFLIGDNVTSQGIDLHKIKRMLLPNPSSASIAYFANMSHISNIAALIQESTTAALQRQVNIRWMDEFIGYSMILLDKNTDDARVHIEYVLPPMTPARRPSVAIWRRRFPSVFNSFRESFDAIWDKSIEPSVANEKAEAVGLLTSRDSGRRGLTADQRKRLIAHVRSAGQNNLSSEIEILHSQGFDCAEYAYSIGDAINASGHWRAEVAADIFGPPVDVTGLRICVGSLDNIPRDARLIAEAFGEASIEFDWLKIDNRPDDYMCIIVARPRPKA